MAAPHPPRRLRLSVPAPSSGAGAAAALLGLAGAARGPRSDWDDRAASLPVEAGESSEITARIDHRPHKSLPPP
ncbi:UNVERIFIED_CONTAM: hypothetical protein K2H54_006105 [Gekko kuhli]